MSKICLGKSSGVSKITGQKSGAVKKPENKFDSSYPATNCFTFEKFPPTPPLLHHKAASI